MLWLRQMGMAAVALLIVGSALGLITAAGRSIIGPVESPDGPIGAGLSILLILAGIFLAHRIYLVLDRRDARRSGRPTRT
jgi:divalent metal cation (Fe/Co/Zn/Cd) transporter